MVAVEIKRKAPRCHTIGEVICARWGHTVHKIFLCFLFETNAIVTSMLLLGGTAVISALTGMNKTLANFLTPLGIVIYTYFGGLKATFISAYLHTSFLYILLCVFMYTVYTCTAQEDVGTIARVWTRLNEVAMVTAEDCTSFGYDPSNQLCGGVSGNQEGSYLTMISLQGLIFGIINIIGERAHEYMLTVFTLLYSYAYDP